MASFHYFSLTEDVSCDNLEFLLSMTFLSDLRLPAGGARSARMFVDPWD